MPDRYSTSDNIEAQYQPGSDETVLRNKLGISSAQEMDDVELQLLEQLYEKVLSETTADQTITTADIREWHRSWLGNVYEWAGRERSVNVAKGDFHFAAASRIPSLLEDLGSKYLSKLTPCE
ncbi:MAG TPA: cell filamentation protein Fic, partial [Woeseiaceae bacterium]|nr:cell filamentation protein Fic [Woeseiaceae bacterium]